MTDLAGNTVKTFNTGSFATGVEIGEKYRIKGTIKKNEAYNNVKASLLTRVAVA